jgi:hypothetical protein
MIAVEVRIKTYEAKLSELTTANDQLIKSLRDAAHEFTFEETHPSEKRRGKMISNSSHHTA